MSALSGVVGLFRTKPHSAVGAGGQMSLADHFRELRGRVMRAALYLMVGTIVALFFYNQLFELILAPYNSARASVGKDINTQPVLIGIGTPLLLQLKLCAVAAVVATSPLWLYEIWSFITPGLHANEKKWTRVFAMVAGPLFLLGVGTGYYVLPKGIAALIGFTPAGLNQLTEFGDFFSFITRMLIVFGIAFEIPLFIVLLNLAGVVSGETLGRYRAWIVVLVFVFAAVATPSTDPFSMLMLAVPMTILVLISEGIARLFDRRKQRRRAVDLDSSWDDDVASPL